MSAIDLFIVNVALPAITRDFQAEVSQVEWLVSGYVLMVAVLPVGMGRLADIYGQRRVYVLGLGLFGLASALCALAPSIEWLIVFRVLQGIGGATILPGTLAITTRAFPVEQRGLAIGVSQGISSLGVVAGPVLGGLLVSTGNWRWIFTINVPLAALGIVMTILVVPAMRDENSSPAIDWSGLLLLTGGLLCVMFAITRAGVLGWTAPVVVAFGLGGVVELVGFGLVERRVRAPIIALGLLRNRTFFAGCLSMFLFSLALFGSQPFWSLFMQNYWGLTPMQGGLAFLPSTALIALLTPIGGLIGQKSGTRLRFVMLSGCLLMAASYLFVALRLGPASTYADTLLPALIVRGVGIPVFISCASLAVMSALDRSNAGFASGTLSMARNVGTATGVALFGSEFAGYVSGHLPADQATSAGNFIASGPSAAAASGVVLGGFSQLALLSALACLMATAAAFAIRAGTRLAMKAAPVGVSEAEEGMAELAVVDS